MSNFEPPIEEPEYEPEPEQDDEYFHEMEYQEFLLFDNKFGNNPNFNPNIDNYSLTVNTRGTDGN